MKYFLFSLFFMFSSSLYAKSDFVSVKADNIIEIIQNGKKYYLKRGDLIQVKEKDGWKRNIKVITSIANGVQAGAAFIGESTYNIHLEDENLHRVNKTGPSSFLTKPIEVEIYNGVKMSLFPGDEIRVLEIDGWKRKIEILNSKSGIKGSAVIGNSTYLEYIRDNVITDDAPVEKEEKLTDTTYEYDSMENLIEKLMNYENDEELVDEEELSSGVEVENSKSTCPEVGKAYKVDRFINVQNKNNKTIGVPKGSTISVKSAGGSCSIEVLELPKESNLNIAIYSPQVKTFPSNLHSDYLTEVQPPSESVKLDSGVKFKLAKHSSVHAYGRRTGKRYKLGPSDTLKISGKHKNGDYIVTRNGEKWEYRIPYEDLDELNDNAQVSINLMETATEMLSDGSVEDIVSDLGQQYDCTDEISDDEEVPLDASDIEWQKCRTVSSKNNRGKTILANDYMDKELKLKNEDINKILEVPEKRRFAKCISSSLRHGTNRSSNPSCAKDAKGNIIPKRIRQATYSTKSGKKKFAGWKLLSKAPKACASRELSTHLADRFVDMTKCLGIDPKELFPIINHESHFQPKTISPTFALGVGQIVSVNYMDFYNKLNQAKSMIKSNSSVLNYAKPLSTKEGYSAYEDSPSRSKKVSRLTAYFLSDLKDKMTGNQKECKGLRNIYENPLTLPSSAKKSASRANDYLRDRENQRLCSPKNPDEGFYMAAVYYMYNKKYFTYMLEKENKKSNLKMTAKQIKDFSIILARWSYNGGVAGVSGPFERLVEKLKNGSIESLNKNNDPIGNKKRKVSGFSNFSNDDFKSYMSYVIKHRYKGGNSRRLEVARYVTGSNGVGGIDGDLKQIEKGEENSCGTTY